MILVDTAIWSLALRRSTRDLSSRETGIVREWIRLVTSGLATLIGPIRQEILSGIRNEKAFEAIRSQLSDFRYLEITLGDYDRAACFFNQCRSKGLVGSPVDMLICAVASRHKFPIFTTDKDFERYLEHLSIQLHRFSGHD